MKTCIRCNKFLICDAADELIDNCDEFEMRNTRYCTNDYRVFDDVDNHIPRID